MASNSIAPSASWAIDSELPIRARRIIVNNLLYSKTSLALWLLISRSGFCSTDSFHGNGPSRVFLCWSKAGKFKICNQNSEKRCEYCHFSKRNYLKKLKSLNFYWDFKDGWRRRTFSERGQYYPKHLETFDAEAETGIVESQEAKDDFINQQKSANCLTQTRRRLLIWHSSPLHWS